MPSPTDDTNIEDLDSSTSPISDDTGAAASAANPNPADSSPATGENDADLLSVVRDVVTESRKDQSAPPAEGDDDGLAAGDKTPKEQDDENYSDVPFHKHPRFKQLLQKAKTYEQDAVRYQNVQTFLDSSGLSAEEAADGLTSMALIKTNPVEAWARIKPTIQKLLIAAGEVLPDDLRQMVQEGKMDQTAALEVSRSRAGISSVQAQRTFDQQRQDRQAQRQAGEALTGAATNWEATRRRKDPNFDAKSISLQKEILFLMQTDGRPNTAADVVAQLDKAYKAVNATFAPPAPPQQQRRPAIKPVTGGQVAGNQRPAEQTTLDIVRANRRTG